MDMRAFHAASTGFEKNEMAPVSCATRAPTAGREETAASRRAQDVLGDEGSRDLMTDDLKSEKIIVMEFGRQKVFDPVGRCIYCNANDCDLGDEHIIPQALAGNMILPAACCRDCEQIVGAKLEGRLLHKTQGMFAAMRLRLEYKSRRPKDRPKSLPYTVIGTDGIPRTVKVPAKKVPRHWMAIVTETSSGIIIGRDRRESARAAVYAMYDPNDFAAIGRPGEQVQFQGANDMRDFARFLCKIAHAITVAEYGLDAFEPWLPNFILGKDDCTLHYYFAGHENKTVDNNGDHSVSLGTWANDGVRIGVRVRLFCRYGTPDYEIAVGKFKKPS
jgi:hypothetical protein